MCTMIPSFKIIGILKEEESMAYTVKNLSELSKVTVRALHFYEEEGLLKPSYYGANGYRYYEEKQLLELQQILFFKELGFSLKQIKKVLGRSDFDQLAALQSHKKALSLEWEKIGKLIGTIDKTIQHIKGNVKMEDKDIFQGFGQITVGKGDEPYFNAEVLVLKSLKQPREEVDGSERVNIAKAGNELYRRVAECMEKGKTPFSKEVQSLVKKHHAFSEKFHGSTKEVYKALSKLYREHPEFRKQLDPIHLELAEFLAEAMDVFADKELS